MCIAMAEMKERAVGRVAPQQMNGGSLNTPLRAYSTFYLPIANGEIES